MIPTVIPTGVPTPDRVVTIRKQHGAHLGGYSARGQQIDSTLGKYVVRRTWVGRASSIHQNCLSHYCPKNSGFCSKTLKRLLPVSRTPERCRRCMN
jgi:hypothetical protein